MMNVVILNKDCKLCGLNKNRINVVSGRGNLQSKILFVAGVPEKCEDEYGLSFFGECGDNLLNLVEKVGLNWKNCRVENVIKCKTPNNRRPYLNEVLSCSMYLYNTILSMRPKLIIPLGDIAIEWFLGKNRIKKGQIYNHITYGKILPLYYPLLVDNSNKNIYYEHLKNNKYIIDCILDGDIGFQIRHKEFGVYQGTMSGAHYWHLVSKTSGAGYYKFDSKDEAIVFIDILCSMDGDNIIKKDDFIIEIYDKIKSNNMKLFSGYDLDEKILM